MTAGQILIFVACRPLTCLRLRTPREEISRPIISGSVGLRGETTKQTLRTRRALGSPSYTLLPTQRLNTTSNACFPR